ncbi:transposase [Streptomyces sp. NPDC059092]|uniref:transposase n=1 Tax=Streptomyces sp. NPDC059092 TaxID=3346725 RepID=UPI0036C11BD4
MAPFRGALDLLGTIPGINQATTEVIIAETGGDMTRFPSAGHLTSWAGVCPAHHESAGRTRNTKVRPGNPCPRGALGLAAFGAARTKDGRLSAGPSQAADRPTRPTQCTGRRRALDHRREPAHAHRQRPLPRPRLHQLHPARPRTRHPPDHQPAQPARLHRHPQPSPRAPLPLAGRPTAAARHRRTPWSPSWSPGNTERRYRISPIPPATCENTSRDDRI